MNKPLKELEEILKYNFKDKDLLRQALTHKSFNNKSNNEKFEFLGDRGLGLIISKKLLDKLSEIDDEISAINIDLNHNNTLLEEEK